MISSLDSETSKLNEEAVHIGIILQKEKDTIV
jgi:hypothetical protein